MLAAGKFGKFLLTGGTMLISVFAYSRSIREATCCWRPSPLLILIAVFALPQLWHAFKDKNVLFLRGRGASIATGGWDLPA